jgi:hypothetical protein
MKFALISNRFVRPSTRTKSILERARLNKEVHFERVALTIRSSARTKSISERASNKKVHLDI